MTDAVGLRELEPPGDRAALERLWVASLGNAWPLLPAGLDLVGNGVVAEDAGTVVGAVGVDPGTDRVGGVQLLLVDPAVQRRGIGTRLLAAATGFFAARGWRFEEPVVDLVADLTRYRPPAGMGEGAGRAGISLEVLPGPDRAEVLAFEAATFPTWLGWFRRWDASVLVARDRAGAIVGTLLFRGPPDATIYTPLLGPEAGTIGCVGVAAGARGAGVGSAMVVRASELLRDAGARTCHIGWVERERFYARAGSLPWRRYRMARRPLAG